MLTKPSKGDSQPRQWPIARQMYQFTQLLLSINQLDTRRILAGDTPGIPRGVNVIQSSRQISESSCAESADDCRRVISGRRFFSAQTFQCLLGLFSASDLPPSRQFVFCKVSSCKVFQALLDDFWCQQTLS